MIQLTLCFNTKYPRKQGRWLSHILSLSRHYVIIRNVRYTLTTRQNKHLWSPRRSFHLKL